MLPGPALLPRPHIIAGWLCLRWVALEPQQGLAMNPGFPLRLFLLLFVPVALLIVVGAWLLGRDRIAAETGLIRSNEINNVVLAVRRLDGELAVPLQQLRVLAEDEALRTAVEGGPTDALAAAFATLIGYNGDIDKLRWIDADGRERVRVDNRAGRPLATEAARLQDQSQSYYFKAAMATRPDGYYLSPLDLNTEFGRIEMPPRPVLRLAAPLRQRSGHPAGILILDIAAAGLLEGFRENVGEARDHAMLVNQAGYWLASPDGDQEWGFQLPHGRRLSTTNPAAWKAISAMPSGQQEWPDGLWTWSTVYPLQTGNGSRIADPQAWLVVTHLDGQLAPARNRAWTQAAVTGGVLLLLFGLAAAWLARAQAGQTRAEIEAGRAHAEAATATRMRDLLERFRLMVEANSNGLLVADREGRIVFANLALERMFGYSAAELLGRRLDALLPEGERRLHGEHLSAYMRAPKAQPMGIGRDLHGRRKDGSEFPIEVSLSPFTENGEQFVDALIADISVRKRLAGQQ